MKTVVYPLKYGLSLALLIAGSAVADAPSSDKATDDCEVVGINYQDNPELTRAEKLALMEQAFYESLKKFEDCNLSVNEASSSAGGDAAGGTSAGQSAASDAMQGTETETEQDTVAANDASEAKAEVSGEDSTEQIQSGPSDNGKIPDDIPPAENDDAIAAQIRIAAEAETDPEIRKKLWNEYRKYKGMNVEH